LPHFRFDSTPSAGAELQSEYLLPREQAVAALQSLRPLRAQIAPLLMISEIRTVAADDLWLSPAYERDVVALHFTWYRNWPPVREILVLIEAALAPFQARPHWGKLFITAPPRMHELYPRLSDFAAIAAEYDPTGKFANSFLRRYR
jgi:xylitol oxidase